MNPNDLPTRSHESALPNRAPGALAPPLLSQPATSTTVKIVVLAFLTLMLMVPLGMIYGVLQSRIQLRDTAREEVSRGWGAEQMIAPPVLSAQVIGERVETIDGNQVATPTTRELTLLPDMVKAQAKLDVQMRSVSGTYQIPVYTAEIDMQGSFSAEDLTLFLQTSGLDVNTAQLEFLTSDMRGVASIERLEIGGVVVRSASLGSLLGRNTALGARISNRMAPARANQLLLASAQTGQRVPFRLKFSLKGTESLKILPLARSLDFSVQSTYPHPSFTGGLLPNQRTVTEKGFSATWQASEFNRDFPQLVSRDQSSRHLETTAMGVRLVQQGEVYQRNDRAGKYSFLFLALSMAGFFLVEILAKLRLHPMHYLQIGLSLGLFYLLLLAFSERLGFNAAYVLSAALITALVSGYCTSIMKGVRYGAIAGSVLALLYGFLFLLLSREQNALMLGAIGLLVLLSSIMYLTRHYDWHFGEASDTTPASGPTAAGGALPPARNG